MPKFIGVLVLQDTLCFSIADTLYRQVDRLVHSKVLIISLRDVPVIDLFGAFALEGMITLANKRETKLILKRLNPAGR